MVLFQIGDYICRDGDSFSGIIKIEQELSKAFGTGTAFLFNMSVLKLYDVFNISNNMDRLLTLKDIERISVKYPHILNDARKEVKEFLKGAILWCIHKELDKL